jgi:hypothetical protein
VLRHNLFVWLSRVCTIYSVFLTFMAVTHEIVGGSEYGHREDFYNDIAQAVRACTLSVDLPNGF